MKLKLLVSLLLVALIVVGCNGGSTETTTDSNDKLVVAVPQDPDFLDPHLAAAAGTEEMMYNIFEGLFKKTADGQAVPAIASDYSISDDGLIYTVTLRDGVKFHNGKTVTMDDVVFSYQRLKGDGETVLDENFKDVTIQAKDDKTIEFTLTSPRASFLLALTKAVLDKDLPIESHNVTPIGTGPYKFVAYNPTQSLTMTRFDDYWNQEKAGKIKDVEFRLFADNATALSSLLSGGADMLPRITVDQIDSLPDGFTIFEGQQNLIQILGLNNAHPAFSKQAVREAINYAIDKDALINRVADGKGTKLGSTMSPVMEFWYQDGLQDLYLRDVEKAKQLLAEAGESDLSFTITVPSNYEFHIKTGEVLIEQLAEAGVKAELKMIEFAVWLEQVYRGRDYEATIIGFDGKIDPHEVMERYISDYPSNFINYANDEYDKLMEQGLVETDPAKRAEFYKQAQTVIAKDSGVIFLMDPSLLVAMKSNLKGYTLYPIYVQDVSCLYFE